jgi:hypothetical protein
VTKPSKLASAVMYVFRDSARPWVV